ncbi:DUF302 domain-containing protein [Magnetococcus sp. PR-3]|uniref:DUF302 domain-containing protein n=1 Tax=Magnetococcus sp. PR-3 TaxID=3120355 RepID=UPI002FCE6640
MFFSRSLIVALLALFVSTAPAHAGSSDAIVKLTSNNDVATTVKKLKDQIAAKGLKLFGVIDHAAAAKEIGRNMAPSQVVMFGKPATGMRVMWHDPAVALDLPMKVLVYQDDVGDTHIVYRKPTSLRQVYAVENCMVLDKMDGGLAMLTKNAAQ